MNTDKMKGAGVIRAMTSARAWLAAVCMGAMCSAYANDTLTMTATMLQGSCNISFIPGETTTGTPITGVFALPDADSENITQACASNTSSCFDTANATAVTLLLSGCGLGQSNTTPAVKVTGPAITAPDAGGINQGNYPYVFRDVGTAGGTSAGYGIALGKVKMMTWSVGGAGIYGAADYIGLTNAQMGSNGNGAYATLWLAVTCANACADPKQRAGTLNANLQFAFSYK